MAVMVCCGGAKVVVIVKVLMVSKWSQTNLLGRCRTFRLVIVVDVTCIRAFERFDSSLHDLAKVRDWPPRELLLEFS